MFLWDFNSLAFAGEEEKHGVIWLHDPFYSTTQSDLGLGGVEAASCGDSGNQR